MLACGFHIPVTKEADAIAGKAPQARHSTAISSALVAAACFSGNVGAAAAAGLDMTKSSKKKKNKKNEKRWPKKDFGVAESSSIRISKLLEQFRDSQSDVYTFDENLDNKERAFVHIASRKMGFSSKSAGRGDQRRISVFKSKSKKAIKKEKERVINVEFSEESNMVLQELFARFPPGVAGLGGEVADARNRRDDKFHRKRDDIFSRVPVDKAEISKKVDILASRIAKTPMLRQIAQVRSKLPIASFENDIMSTVNSHQVVIVCGETGCGKTTQVPQYILDHMWSKGEHCKIICTQPRRISAISVAERISNERGESVGGTVGYKIRLESKGDKYSSIVFCTNGVLLRVLVSRGNRKPNVARAASKSSINTISDITHIVVDEIHERDWASDFIIAILRDALPSNPHLRLILMSATVDTERFSQYFGGCPIIQVPGFTHPVRTFYLEDALDLLNLGKNSHQGYISLSSDTEMDEIIEEYRGALDEAITLACTNDDLDPIMEIVSSKRTPSILNYRHPSTGVTPLMVLAGGGTAGDVYMLLSSGADLRIKDCDGRTALEWAERGHQDDVVELLKKHSDSLGSEGQSLVDKYLATMNPELVDDDLIEKLLKKICCDSMEGAVLVFLPGWDDINRTRERLTSSPFFRDQSKFIIIPLHSMVPSVEQKKVFRRVPHGCRKIVLSTNIAETAVTIDDVVCVIDSGRMKEKSYDPYGKVSTLQSLWVSKASARQREGRAGRCQPGMCYHLYSKTRAESLPDFQVPEIRRMPIEELCLQIKLMDQDCNIDSFLQKTLDPPSSEAITNGIALLQDIGALSDGEKLTEFGRKLGSLPVHPSTGKMLLFAISMSCLDPALTLACASDYRDPFTLPMFPEDKKKATAAKAELSSLYRAHSEQLAVVAGFECWKNAKESGKEVSFCSQYFVAGGAMNMLSGMRKQLQAELVRQGFLPEEDSSGLSSNSRDPGILQAVLMAGMYPMVGILHPPQNGKRLPIFTASGEKVYLHQHSICRVPLGPKDARPLLSYDEIMRSGGGKVVKNCTIVGPLPFLLFAKDIAVAPPSGEDNEDSDGNGDDKTIGEQSEDIMSSPENTVTVIVDGWAHFTSTALSVAHIYCLRERLSAAIMFQVKHPREALPPDLSESVFAIVRVLSADAFVGISPTLIPAEPQASTLSSTLFRKGHHHHHPNGHLNTAGNGSTFQRPVRGKRCPESGASVEEAPPWIFPQPPRFLSKWHDPRRQVYYGRGTG